MRNHGDYRFTPIHSIRHDRDDLLQRINRRRRHANFDDSLLRIFNKSIDGINDRVAQISEFLWWFACPNTLGLCIAMFIVDESKRHLLYGVFGPAFSVCMDFAY